MTLAGPIVVLIVSVASFGLLTSTVVWNNAQKNDISTIAMDKDMLASNVTSLEGRVALLQEMCTDTQLNNTVNELIERVDELNAQLDSASGLLRISPPELVSKGQLVPSQLCSLQPCQVVTIDDYLVMNELQAAAHAVWAPAPGFPTNAMVNVTETGNYWFGMFIGNNERSGGGTSTFTMELVDENDTPIDSIIFTELHDINGYTYYRSHYTAMELQAGTFIKYRAQDSGTLWVFSDVTFGFVIKV